MQEMQETQVRPLGQEDLCILHDSEPVSWSSDMNNQLFGKVPDTAKDWGQKEKWVSEG